MDVRGWVSRLAGVVIGVGLLAASLPAQAQQVVKFGLATLNDAQHEYVKRLAAAVDKDSGGRLKSEVYPASQLGPIPRQIEATQLGAIQVFTAPPEFFDGLDPRFGLLSAAGLFRDMNHLVKSVADPEFRKAFYELGSNRGIRVGGILLSGPTAINSRKAINTFADVKGLKLRVLASPFQTRPIAHLGATAVPMALGDVLPALQQGTIDGVMSTVPVLSALRYYDAAKFITETNFSFTTSMSAISKVWFDKLPPDLQKVVADNAYKIASEMQPFVEEFYQAQRKVWAEKGGTVIDIPKADKDKMIAELASLTEKTVVSENADLKALWDVTVAAAKRNQ